MSTIFATVYDKVVSSNHDHTVINNVRTWLRQPFQAPEWLDLRVGFLLSITKAGNDDDTTSGGSPPIAETIVASGAIGPAERYWIGLKDRSAAFPHNYSTAFIGYSNVFPAAGPLTGGDSVLESSDAAIGTTNANFWRPHNGYPVTRYSGIITDGVNVLASSQDGVQQHFVQSAAGAGGYATLLMLRLQRNDATASAKIITVTTKTGTYNGDVLYTNTPTELLLRTNLAAFPSSVQQWGPVTLSVVPDCLYLYWPFHNSRLRIHAAGILKAR